MDLELVKNEETTVEDTNKSLIEGLDKTIERIKDGMDTMQKVLHTQEVIVEIAKSRELDEDCEKIIEAFEQSNEKYKAQLKENEARLTAINAIKEYIVNADEEKLDIVLNFIIGFNL